MSDINKTKRFIWITDVHNNHPKISNEHLANQVVDMLMNLEDKSSIDYFVDTGDFFDRPTQMDSGAGKLITKLITFILTFCAKYNIKVLVLKGTSNHDGRQQEHWVSICEGLIDRPELIYMDKIGIHYEDGFNFLCVPDNATSSPAKTEAVVRSLLKENNLEQVDMSFTHGMYKHHLGKIGVKLETHCSEYYNSIVRCIILNGHVHTRSLWKRIATGGTVTRNRQGEEEPKGIHDVRINFSTGKVDLKFIENVNAFKFFKLRLETLDVEEAIQVTDAFIKEKFDGIGYLNITYPDGLAIQALSGYVREMYPDIVLDTDKVAAKDTKSLEEELEEIRFKTVPLNKDTLPDLVKSGLESREKKYTPRHQRIFEQVLAEIG